MTSAPLSFTWQSTDTNTEMAITARNVVKTYTGSSATGPKQALSGIDLNVPKGGIFGLLGPNGAGKSTFINILGGTVVKTSGAVTVWGTDLDQYPRQARANIGIVPQELNIDVYFTPRELLHFTAGLYGVPASERDVDAILETVGLTEQANAYARTLSGGMRRRLLVGKAMVHQPPILVLDEPTNDLDVDTLRALEEALLEFAGCAVVISHDRWFLDRIATHILAFEGNSHVEWFEGNYQAYEEDKKRRLGADALQPTRIKYKPIAR